MPGTYTHLAIANELPRALKRAGGPVEAYAAALAHLKYCELGAISPDYPYLVIGDPNARRWADLMHRTSTGALLAAGASHVAGLGGEPRRKAMAWLLGYGSHVAADMTVHPVVELKVGPYDGHETAHRVCEMHQDVFVFRERMNLSLEWAEYFRAGVGTCGDDGLDPDIRSVWSAMLASVHPQEYRSNPPDFDRWHRMCRLLIDGIAEEGGWLVPLARHVCVGQGLVYPREDELDQGFLKGLRTPGGVMDYLEVFDRAVANVAAQSDQLAGAILHPEAPPPAMLAGVAEWDLDTGRIDRGARVFWEGVPA